MSKIAKALEKAEQGEQWVPGSALPLPEANGAETIVPIPSEHVLQTDESKPPRERTEVSVEYRETAVTEACFGRVEERRLLDDNASRELRDAFNVVRTRILQQTRSKGLNTIMVTSPGRRDGKTTVAINLAISIARDASQTALLVDANLRWPGISCGLGLDTRPGLTEHLLRDEPLSSLFVNPGISKLVVLPAGASQEDSLDIISSPRMQRLVGEMKKRYPDRYVIFDCPHLIGMPDALAFAEYVDGIVLIAGEGETGRVELEAALELLEGRNLLGVVLNKAR